MSYLHDSTKNVNNISISYFLNQSQNYNSNNSISDLKTTLQQQQLDNKSLSKKYENTKHEIDNILLKLTSNDNFHKKKSFDCNNSFNIKDDGEKYSNNLNKTFNCAEKPK